MTEPQSGLQPAARRPPPAPPLVSPTGIVQVDAVIDNFNSIVAPFQNAPPAEQGAAGWVAQGLGGVLGVIGAPAQLIDTAFAMLTAPIAALFPALPAVTLLGMHVGPPHTHTHPPSLIPPAPPVPLPSIGMLMGSGAISVLGGGMPLARAGDIGISITCGSFAPPFEVFTGSSNVFVGGARAARILDITKHCNPTSMGPFDIAMAGAGLVAGAAGAIATNSAVAAAQLAADAAVLALKLLCGKDPGLPPGMGVLIGPPVPNVLIGGFPCPPVGEMVVGAIMKKLKALYEAAKKKLRSARRGNANCADASHPIYLVTGENFDNFTDYVSPGLFRWDRGYTSARASEQGPLGYGFRHGYQRTLDLRLHKATFIDHDGVELEFPKFPRGQATVSAHGYALSRIDAQRYALSTRGQPTMMFAGDRFAGPLKLVGLETRARALAFEYDEQGWLIGAIERGPEDQRRYQFQHDAAGRIVAIYEHTVGSRGPSSAPACRFACTYTAVGELHQVRDAGNGLWVYTYDQAHRWTRQVDPRGYAYTFRYDDEGRCVWAGGQDGLWETSVEYVPDERRTVCTEGDGAVWEYHYDHHGFIVRIVNPQGGELIRERDGEGRVLAEIDPGGRRIEYLYDAGGAHCGRRDRFGYVHPPEQQSPGLGDPFVRRLPRTAQARLLPSLATLARERGDLELPAALAKLGAEVFTGVATGAGVMVETREWHDLHGRRIGERDARGRERAWKFDETGNLVAMRDRDGQVHRWEVASWNLVGRRVDPLGHRTTYEYSTIEQLVGLTDPLGNTARWTYDAGERLIEVRRNGRLRDRYEYDRGDHLIAKYDGDDELIFRNAEYHANHFVKRRELASGGEHRFDYDDRGRIVEASTEAHEVRCRYEDGGRGRRLADLRDGEGVERRFAGERETVRVLGRFAWSLDRGADGALTLTSPTGRVTRIRRKQAGVVLRECSNGTREWLEYDDEGRLLGRVSARPVSQAAGWAAWGTRYGYSAEGDLVSVDDSARGLTTYSYDAAHRLTGERTAAANELRYEHDEADNLVHKPGLSRLQVGLGNRAEASALEVFEYDGRDRVSVRRTREGAVSRYAYDSFDMLERVEWRGGARPASEWRAAYDAIGRRLWSGCEGARRELYWDGDRIAAEIAPEGRLRVYLYADHDALVPLGFVDYDSRDAAPEHGREYVLITDGVGMPLHVEDQACNIVWWATRVDPWGEITVHPSATIELDLRWPGHLRDPETGLHYNRYRYYDPALGRYLQPDPSGYRGSEVNLYAYCKSPLVEIDLLGLTHEGRKPNAEGADQSTSGDNDGTDRPPQDGADRPADLPADLVVDPTAVYGYFPTEDSQFHPDKGWPDWRDPDATAAAREVRLEYHEGLNHKREVVDQMRGSNASEEAIARRMVDMRNQDRIDSYAGNPEGLDRLYARNEQEYGRREGPTYESQRARGKTDSQIVDSATKSNQTMDILTGIVTP